MSGLGIVDCTAQEKCALIDTLWQLTQRRWIDLMLAGRHGSGCEKIARSAIEAPIPSQLTEDTTFLAFRFHGLAPMVGYRDGRVFHVVWIDRAFRAYRH